jgi:hypothetical protein
MSGLKNASFGNFEHFFDPGELVILAPDEVMPGLRKSSRRIAVIDPLCENADHLRIAKLEGALRLAVNVLRDGDASERAAVATQLQKTLKAQRS